MRVNKSVDTWAKCHKSTLLLSSHIQHTNVCLGAEGNSQRTVSVSMDIHLVKKKVTERPPILVVGETP